MGLKEAWRWFKSLKQDTELILGPHLYGICVWNREWLALISSVASNRRAWSVFIEDTANLLDGVSSTDPVWMPSDTYAYIRFRLRS